MNEYRSIILYINQLEKNVKNNNIAEALFDIEMIKENIKENIKEKKEKLENDLKNINYNINLINFTKNKEIKENE